MTDRPGPGAPPFSSHDPDLLQPAPCFELDGEDIDPAQQGYTMVHNYAAYFWRPYLGNTAFALWELLLSFCYGERDVAFPSISRLARMLTNSDHSRAVVTGRVRRSNARDHSPTTRRRTLGALEVLRRERLVQVQRRGRGPTVRYTFHVLKVLPLLTPEQLARLSPQLQYDHANWLERYGIDEAAYRQAYEADDAAPACGGCSPRLTGDASSHPHAETAAPGTASAASATPTEVSGQPGADTVKANNPQEDRQIEEWWQDTLCSLRLQTVKGVFDTYLMNTRPLACNDGELTVRAARPWQCGFLEFRMAPLVLRELVEASAGQVRSVRFVAPDVSEA